ncbi:MAG: cysteine desulfurase family protein [Planctomycetota bacterium]
MADPTIYLDNNSTTRPSTAAREAVARTLDTAWHNPSSVHRPGQAARHEIELARASVARLINCRPRELIFTSGGTESIELAVRGLIAAADRPVLVKSDIEHAAVRDLIEMLGDACEVRATPLDGDGVIDAEASAELLDGATLACLQWANNETGAIQPIGALGRACRAAGVPLVVDGTQWVGKMPTDLGTGVGLGIGSGMGEGDDSDDAGGLIDAMAFAAHKLHGPKGVGALFVRRGTRLGSVRPGSQELGRRGGTENVPGIAGFGAACEEAATFLADSEERVRLGALRDRLERGILERCPAASVNGPTSPGARLWNTSSIGFRGLEAEALLLLLSERGVCASAGAACSSGSLEPSPVLLAMGIDPAVAHGSIRLSLSRWTTEDEIDRAVEIVASSAEALGASLPTG